MKACVLFLLLLVAAAQPAAASCDVRAVWWWNAAAARETASAEGRLQFLAARGVNEVFFCVDAKMSCAELAGFVRKVRARGLRISWLAGDVSWIEPQNLGFDETWRRYQAYQQTAPADARFDALHLDVEPHQNRKLSDARKWQLYADFVLRATATVHKGGEKLEWDIPFWLDGLKVARDARTDASLLELVMDVSDGVVLMSYRDSAAAMLDTAREELACAATRRCRVLLGAETGKTDEGDFVSFYEEGDLALRTELEKVHTALRALNLPVPTGTAVHHVGAWMKLKE